MPRKCGCRVIGAMRGGAPQAKIIVLSIYKRPRSNRIRERDACCCKEGGRKESLVQAWMNSMPTCGLGSDQRSQVRYRRSIFPSESTNPRHSSDGLGPQPTAGGAASATPSPCSPPGRLRPASAFHAAIRPPRGPGGILNWLWRGWRLRRGIPILNKLHHPEAFPCCGNSDKIFEGYLSRSNGNSTCASCDILGRYTQLRTFLNCPQIPNRCRARPLRLERNHLIPSNSPSSLQPFDFYEAS